MSQFQKRQTAKVVRINDILNGTYVKVEGLEPNYIRIADDRKISRANLIGTVISKSDNPDQNFSSIDIDDKSSSISIRSFEDKSIFDNVNIGDVVLLIGKPREYGGEKYIVLEIIKPVNVKWLELRMLQLDSGSEKNDKDEITDDSKEKNIEDEVKDETIKTADRVSDDDYPYDTLINTIRDLDQGPGADFEEVIKKSEVKDAEKMIMRLLEEGDVFEIKPGKLKVLE